MCGIFGYVAAGDKGPSMKRLASIARATERRGPHAFGLAWLDTAGRLRHYRQEGRITDAMGVLAMAADARMLIGHCRWTTQGPASDAINNHPHPSDGGWYVHNGKIDNYAELVEEHDLLPTSACDSEVLGLIAEQSGERTLLGRCTAAALAARAADGLAMLGLWKPGRMVVIKRGKPMSIGTTKRGTYIGSLADGLPAESGIVRDWTARQFTRGSEGVSVNVLELERRPEELGESGRARQRIAERQALRKTRPASPGAAKHAGLWRYQGVIDAGVSDRTRAEVSDDFDLS